MILILNSTIQTTIKIQIEKKQNETYFTLEVQWRAISVQASMCHLDNMFQFTRLFFNFSSQEQATWCQGLHVYILKCDMIVANTEIQFRLVIIYIYLALTI